MKKLNPKAVALHSVMLALAGLLLSSPLSAAAAKVSVPSAGVAANKTTAQFSALPALALKAHAYQQVQYQGQPLQLLVDKTGLQIRNQQGKTLASAEGHFSRFSTLLLPTTTAAVSSKNAATLLIAAVDDESQVLQLWSWQQQGLQLIQQQLITSRVVEDLCFYHSNDNQQLSLFLLGDRGGADQLLLQQQGRWLKQPLRIRELSVPYDSKACAVDHTRGYLYLTEHSQAIWRYQAESEADEGRQLLQVKQPFGVIAGELVSLTVLPDGSLLALEEEPGRVLHLQWPELASGQLDQSVAAQVTTQLLGGEWAYLSALSQPKQTLLFVSAKGEPVQSLQLSSPARSMPVSKKSTLLPMQQVQPTVQTPAASARGDVIDDPAIWHHAVTPAQSRILATDKRNGLEVYDLQGKLLQQLKVGRLNNVDVRYGLPFAGKPHDVAVASLRNNNSLQLFAINSQGEVTDAGQIATQLEDIYGLCLFQPAAGQVEVFVNDKSGLIEQYQLSSDGKRWQGRKVRQLQVPGQPEGCVVDDARQQLYVGEEDVGIWRFAAAANASSVGENIILADGETLVADVEGLAFAPGEQPYLLASSQGNDSYVLFSALPPYQAVLRFRVMTNPELAIDGTSETDGLDLTVRSLGPGFTEGALIIQDGRKRMPEQGQNLKYIPWQSVLQLIGQP